MTEKLYYNNIDQDEFEAKTVNVSEDKKQWKVVLDRTCFYPEGGGQPADKGWLNNIPVTEVQKEGDTIFHYLSKHPGEGTIKGKIDMQWRKDFMQQHTGQHIISGALWKIGKYKTVSVHMGGDYTTIEIEAPEISEEELINTEDLANKIIAEDMPVRAILTTNREVDNFPLRKPTGVIGNVRLVQIGDFDCVGCGGLHLDSTRKVQLIKAIGLEKIRGNARIAWKIGERALKDYRQKDKVIAGLKPLLATREDLLVQKTEELLEELSTQKKKSGRLESRLAETIANDLYRNSKDLPGSGCKVITQALNDEDELLVKRILKNLLKKEKLLVCLVNQVSGRLRWSIGCSEDISFPFDDIKAELLAIIDGKGGGRHPLWQGSGQKPEAVEDFLKAFQTLVEDNVEQ
jgi:alanyl-tRNA synthetase